MINNDSEFLKNKSVVVLRAKEQAKELKISLEKLGANVISIPLIKITPVKEATDQINEKYLSEFDAIIFTSVNGTKVFYDTFVHQNMTNDLLNKKIIYVVGPKTKQVCEFYGIHTEKTPDIYDAEGLLEFIGTNLAGKKVLLLLAEGAREVIAIELNKKGAHVTTLGIYKNWLPPIVPVFIPDGSYVLFTSSSTADRFFISPFYSNQKIIAFCIGRVTAETVRKYIQKPIYIADNATVESLVDKMIEYAKGSI